MVKGSTYHALAECLLSFCSFVCWLVGLVVDVAVVLFVCCFGWLIVWFCLLLSVLVLVFIFGCLQSLVTAEMPTLS